MAHLKEFDGQHSTVIIVQMENETGLLGDSRDRSQIANKRFREPVPSDLLEALQSKKADMHPEFQDRYPDICSAVVGQST